MPEEKSAIEICDVTKLFGDAFKALDGVSLSIRKNEFFTLLGPSGCGKTTLLRLIAGFEYPTAGTIQLHGKDIATLPPYQRPINTVFQNYALFPHMTASQNIGFGLEMLGRPKAEIAARVDEMLRLVRMEGLRHRRTTELSGGQQQRVALARALAPTPKVLLLDEPLSALDYKLRKEMQIELKRLQLETGITFIFVTHDQEEALTMSDRIAVLSGGRVLQVGNPREIYDCPGDRFVADFIGEANFLSGEIIVATKDRAQVRLASGADILARLPDTAPQQGKVTIIVRPEHAEVHADGRPSPLSGTLESIVYFGTDTHLHVRLAHGDRFVVRRQNSPLQDAALVAGATVGVAFDLAAAQILRN
ncbi:ABC transporter ATP-binding protein [Pseudaminobacter soli (ex Li et al. 2025)]|uniref:Spermidine/putrescine import ATP-binding protein PotA n=1 Tax=Pseudaminobacter soli (ex Li et al. 2025) TaxID=1295366 RepID=A0A2P7S8Q8_9HYPH|nr:ABC transporter ATP-binding protein [Mesorhizobium soli]PSJ58876.1 spermidine/putrescine ABC transporter ATP-binding protein [Mesorhizobium soli]